MLRKRQYYKFVYTVYLLGPVLFVKSQNCVTLAFKEIQFTCQIYTLYTM